MAKSLLVPFDGSEQAHSALEYALVEYPDRTITAIHVLNPAEWGYGSTEGGLSKRWYEQAREDSKAIQDEAEALAADHGIEITTTAESGIPGDVIAEYVGEHDVEHIVIGSHGRSGTKRLLLGSVAETVARTVSIPVTIVG